MDVNTNSVQIPQIRITKTRDIALLIFYCLLKPFRELVFFLLRLRLVLFVPLPSANCFMAAAEANLDNFALLESEADSNNEIADFRYMYINRRGANFFQMVPEQIINQKMTKLKGIGSRNALLKRCKAVALTGTPLCEEFIVKDKAGKATWVYLQIVRFENRVGITWRDITERKEQERVLLSMAQNDTLTGLPNRALFRDRLERALIRARRKKSPIALMFIDVDHFKEVNDRYGHAAGDELLCEFGKRLQQCVRASDTVARLSGDEFTIILEDIHAATDGERVARNIINKIRQPFLSSLGGISMTTSIGIALFSEETLSADELLRRADIALYDVKRQGRDSYFTYRPALRLDLYKENKISRDASVS